MTNREKEVLEVIKENPMISQKDLAEKLGITRSSAAVHITNLLKKGYLLGKGYIVSKDEEYVSIIGGANMDIQGFPNDKLIYKDSNPGKSKISLGGVGRNIGENLTKLGINTKLITALGEDIYGNKILEEAKTIGMDMEHSIIMRENTTSTYLSILDETGDMMVAIAHMDIFDKIPLDFIKSKKTVIENSGVCIIDTNIPQEIIEYIVNDHQNVKFFLDTVSTTKAKKVKNIIGKFHTIKLNRIEAEILSGIPIKKEEDLERSAEFFLEKGVKRVFITLGEEGVYYNDGKNKNKIPNPKVRVINATGAGDAFMAAMVYCYLKDFSVEETIKFSMTASILALSHEDTINPNMSVWSINNKMKEIGIC
ncbi:TPA: winged helix-turn-helix transcriptional regulator [Clostridium botulinum]|uniref:PfkB family carbohydrate kinase n=1 Tax=Clostridium botulinum TaxID=1491 RepID=UPI0029B6FC61|nr:winged helix-turn-helix transcriptional regulator [Clostridium botulinum]HDK7178998.1 winged helix-turn-helix transcriptional regulator [Clostridium botulinum]HDK7191251.1 winged helix-turn-helix transcriptional regulator [Clostridium botulinum]HDK7214913.1 winged helix-turn-helix transcriptional regulator [Clostridium botulinum]HDK7224692.1 winged helix-turn-helix transcriptional regulator [Clostridium botulinum]